MSDREANRVDAAGGVVVRGSDPSAEVAVVHRPRYDDWSLPKGKLDEGEGFEAAALREVEEETGYSCSLGRELEANAYVDHKGRDKVVRWWQMSPEGGEFVPNDEVDEMRWVSIAEAIELVDYDHDRALLRQVRDGLL